MAKKSGSFPIGTRPFCPSDIRNDLAGFPELRNLTAKQLDELAQDFTHAAAFAAIGFPMQRDDVSGLKAIRRIYLADIVRALKRQCLPISTSRRYSDAAGATHEALVFRLARLVAARVRVKHPKGYTVPLAVPADPYRLFKAAFGVAYN